MLIPVVELLKDFNVNPKNILHVGAHLAEESENYNKYFDSPIVWVEAQPNLCSELRKKLTTDINTVIEACISDKEGEILSFNVSSNSQSSSLLNFGTHLINHPECLVTEVIKLKTQRLDTVLRGRAVPDFINLDIQGVELRALKSLGQMINQIQIIYTEVNKQYVYENCDLINDLDYFLKGHGFKRIATRWKIKSGWGDALYVKESFKRRTFQQFLRSYYKLLKFYLPQIKSLRIYR
jgi:FkbM family methyltransferase